MDEPIILVNGTRLTEAQAMAVRVAASSFYTEIVGDPTALGDDEMGYAIRAAYKARLAEVLRIMQPLPEPPLSPTPSEA